MKLRAIILIGVLSAMSLPAAESDVTRQFQEALFEEEANRNLPAAIEGYEAVVRRLDEQRQLAATAVFRLGECYRKLGRTNDAVQAYQRVLNEFEDQETLVQLSEQNLQVLKPKPATQQLAWQTDENFLKRYGLLMPPAYTVRNGDTLDGIVQKYSRQAGLDPKTQNWSIEFLKELNPSLSEGALKVGQVIRLRPGGDEPESRIISVDPSTNLDPETRVKMRALLEQEIELTRQLLEEKKSFVKMGAVSNEEVTNIERELARLQRQLAALDVTENSLERQWQLLEEEIDLVNRLISSKERMIDAGRSPKSDLMKLKREKLQLNRELLLLNQPQPTSQQVSAGGIPATMTSEEAGALREVKSLAANSPDLLNETDPGYQRRPIEQAASKGWTHVLDFLLEAGARTDLRGNQGYTPLHFAAWYGHLAAIEMLIEHGVELDRINSRGQTPLYLAALKGYTAVSKALIQAGANLDKPDDNQSSPLEVTQNLEIARALLEAGANPNGVPGSNPPIVMAGALTEKLDLLLEYGADPKVKDNQGNTPLHVAVREPNFETTRRLLALGLDPNARNKQGVSVIEPAALNAIASSGDSQRGEEDSEIFQLLLEKGASPDTILSKGHSLIRIAIRFYDTKSIELLLENGANPNGLESEERTPLHYAIEYWLAESTQSKSSSSRNIQTSYAGTVRARVRNVFVNDDQESKRQEKLETIIRQLLSHGANPELPYQPDSSMTPLFWAAIAPDTTVLTMLLEAQANVSATNEFGQTPLFSAVGANQSEAVRLLVEAGADVDHGDVKGNTPLHMAVLHDNFEAAKALIELGADKSATNEAGETPEALLTKYTLNGVKTFRSPGQLAMYYQEGEDRTNELRPLPTTRIRGPLNNSPANGTASSSRKTAELFQEE